MTRFLIPFIVIFCVLSSLDSIAQNQPNSRSNTSSGQDADLKFGMEGQTVKKNKKKKRSSNSAFDYNKKVREYEDRVDAAVAKNKKMSKEMAKPQYSDPRYFGHKKLPEKNAVGRKKYCKVCGIRH